MKTPSLLHSARNGTLFRHCEGEAVAISFQMQFPDARLKPCPTEGPPLTLDKVFLDKRERERI